MSVRKADDFIADIERQFDWYLAEAGWEITIPHSALLAAPKHGGAKRAPRSDG